MKPRLLLVLLAALCACDAPAPIESDNVTFVTRLGVDTIAVEQFTSSDDGVSARVVLRSPEVRIYEYELDLDGDALARYEARTYSPGTAEGAEPLRREVATPDGDSLRIEVVSDGQTWTGAVAAGPDVLPFIDMVHWPFELVLTRATVGDSLVQPLFTPRRTLPFGVHRSGPTTATLTHPTRGTMTVNTSPDGHLQSLDAGATTRKLTVERVQGIDFDAFAARADDLPGGGPLSGRGEASIDVDGATLSVDYGQPLKRGRAIWGELVPWGERWRTGANQATHFETTATIDLGGLIVPPGRYTLYTIPEADGGTLIVNKRTGQTGTSYDESQDLGRVTMTRFDQEEVVEPFTIAFDRAPGMGGVLKLMWDQSVFSVPFSVVE